MNAFLSVAVKVMAGSVRGVLPVVVLGLLVSSCDRASESPLPVSRLTPEQPCDVRQGCRAADDSVAVTVTFGAQPRALQPFPLHIQVDGPQRVDSVTVAFSMPDMDMGANRYRLIAEASAGWHADITLPICMSGRTDWLADFELVVADRRLQMQVPFVLEK